ncbi:hypothetical protein DFQ01_106115 [Paenibacillus cellulosilyticus]|uniref:Glycoside hydrolase/deacetylase ChbG (UPF0249 family) n=1 Tax=Paenibacillus cellulosilyticus TaxID=375489 RepID=A0A2V2YUJ1_9BACL|nr:polysaccharide deacetylase family protein [Paenibacillus cellulosilyticus]PWW04831.1 hypothetical protein DFQ01_106115 [Paenibacillus cellulosilyticus]QKS45947.1 ChbG/HpnK family deacetylase [Paenibacillus cellulosilyticus]
MLQLQQLGYRSDDRLLIINADDFGLTQGTNEAIIHLLEKRAATSTSLMMPCPSSSDAISRSILHGHHQVGIHLTLTSDAKQSYAPVHREKPLHSLTQPDGTFHTNCTQLERHAELDDVRVELEAQIVEALAKGIEITHLDSHAGSVLGLHTGRDFLEIVFELCVKYQLPFNLPRRIVEQPFFSAQQLRLFRTRLLAAQERGILTIDDMIALPYCFQPEADYRRMKLQLVEMIRMVKPGITQLTVHPSLATDSLRTVTDCSKEREFEHQLMQDDDVRQLLRSEGIKLTAWRDIRDLQRSL